MYNYHFILLLLFLIQSFILIYANKDESNQTVSIQPDQTITIQPNETVLVQPEVSCTTADGDTGFCKEALSCNVTEDRRERLVNCGSVLRGKLNQICCPKNLTLDSDLINYRNDPNCGRHFDFWNIVGGHTIKPHYYPWTVALYQVVRFASTAANNFTENQFYRFICGGTLVSSQHVVSAGHCVVQGYRKLTAQDFIIKVGAHNIDSSGSFYRVANVWPHPNYRSYQRYNDISLFKLSTPVKSDRPLYACLPDYNSGINSVLKEGTPLTVAGWGTVSWLGRLSKNLQAAKVKYINNAECSRNYTKLEGSSIAYPNGIDSSMICAGSRYGGVDSCQGDSGGPLALETTNNQVYLIGVVSFGFKCAQPNYPGVYTRVSTYLNWLVQMMKL